MLAYRLVSLMDTIISSNQFIVIRSLLLVNGEAVANKIVDLTKNIENTFYFQGGFWENLWLG